MSTKEFAALEQLKLKLRIAVEEAAAHNQELGHALAPAVGAFGVDGAAAL